MKMLTDNPVKNLTEDKFGFRFYADLLAHSIRDTQELPFCIGIFAEWGAGKSSLMNMIQSNLEENLDAKTIWFNPWKYDKKEDLWSALIQSILYKIAEDNSSDISVKDKAKDLAKATSWLMLKKGVSAVTGGILGESELENFKNAWSKQDELHYRHINNFERDFEEVISLYTKNGKLVVFVDDLDRCLPQNAITVLESLKLFIGNAKCVFVLGMDHVVIEQGITFKFGKEINFNGRDYLDKIIQVPFYLPPVPFGKLRESLQVSKTANYPDSIWKLVEFGLGGNPRKTKRFVNCAFLLKEILKNNIVSNDPTPLDILTDSDEGFARGDQSEINNENLVNIAITGQALEFYISKLLIFQMAFAEFYHHLKLYPEDWENFEELLWGKLKHKTLPKIREKLVPFWENIEFRNFMEKTSVHVLEGVPGEPGQEIVEPLISAISMVAPDEERYLKDLKSLKGTKRIAKKKVANKKVNRKPKSKYK